jgi:hypothetical protein
VKLPRDWLGPRSELVPIGPAADRHAAAAKASEEPDGELIELVPPASLTQDDFWGGALDSIPRPVVGPQPVERPRRFARGRAREEDAETGSPADGEVAARADAEPVAAAPDVSIWESVAPAERDLASPVPSLERAPLDDGTPEAPRLVGQADPPRPERGWLIDAAPAISRPDLSSPRVSRRRRRLTRRTAGLVAAAATLLVGAVGESVLGAGSPAQGPTSLAVIRAPVSSLPHTGTVTTSDPLKPWRLPARAVRSAGRRSTPRHAAVHTSVSSTSVIPASYSESSTSTSYTATPSSGYEPTSSHSSSRPVTTAKPTPSGPTGSGAPFGPGTLGS